MRSIMLIFSFVLSGISVEGQMLNDMRYGVKIGVTHNNITDIHHESRPRIAGNIGGFITLPIVRGNLNFMFQPELLVSWQGEYFDKTGNGDKMDKYFMTFINVPLMLKGYFSDNESDFFVALGPYVGFKLSETFEPEDGNRKLYPNYDYPNNEYAKFDYGAVAAIGYSFERKYEVELRLSYGLVDTTENDIERLDTRNTSFALNFSYLFDQ